MRKTMMYDGVNVLTPKDDETVLVIASAKRGEYVQNITDYDVERFYGYSIENVIEYYTDKKPTAIAQYLKFHEEPNLED